MDPSSLVLIGAITPASGIIGSLVFPALQRRFVWSNLGVLVLLVLLVSCIPAYGCLGFLPFVRRMRVGGLTTPGEMFGLAVYFGTSLVVCGGRALTWNRVRVRGFSKLREGIFCRAHSTGGRSPLVRSPLHDRFSVAHATAGTPCSPSRTRYVPVTTSLPRS